MSAKGYAPSRTTRTVILAIVGALFAVPILSMLEFTLRGGLEGGYNADRWVALFTGQLGPQYRPVFTGIGNSLLLALVTVVIVLAILLPTLVLVHLRFPRIRRLVEFVCLLPITIPAIVLVVGLAPVYAVIGRTLGSGVWTLAFAYGITALPFAYRALQAGIDSMDVSTLSEAARSLGAGWPTVLFRVLLPGLRRAVLAAAFITIAVVLGEYTIAALLNRINLQTSLVVVSKNDPFMAVIFSLLSLLAAFLLLFIIGRVGSGRRSPSRPRRQGAPA